MSLVSSTKREAQHQQHEETIQRQRQGFGHRMEDCDWEVTQSGRKPNIDKKIWRSTQAHPREVRNARERFRLENLSSVFE